jgi:hydrogenase maturation protease
MEPREESGVLVIGVGNPNRGDDALGLVAARQIREMCLDGVDVVECQGDLLTLLDLWGSARSTILIDAVSSGGAAGAIRRFEASGSPLPGDMRAVSTHGIGIGEVVELARILDRLPPRLVVIGVEGLRFGVGEELSPEVERTLGSVLSAVLQEAGCTSSP